MAETALRGEGLRLEPRRVVIRPPGRWPGFGLRELWAARAIAFVLAQRSLKVRYRQTVIGAAWVLVQPLLLMLVFTLFLSVFVDVRGYGMPYALFVYIALVGWSIAAKVISEGSTSIANNADLVRRVYFPRAYLPIAVTLATVVDLAFNVAMLVILLLLFGVVPGPAIAFAPVFLAMSLAAALGVTLWLSALHAAYRDVAQLLPFLVQVWFFLTPIIYPSSVVPDQLAAVFWLNPMAGAVEGLRWSFAGAPPPPLEALALGSLGAAVLLISGYAYFRHREPFLPDVV